MHLLFEGNCRIHVYIKLQFDCSVWFEEYGAAGSCILNLNNVLFMVHDLAESTILGVVPLKNSMLLKLKVLCMPHRCMGE